MIVCKTTGEKVDNYNQYLKTEHWKYTRLKVLKKYKNKCYMCSYDMMIQVHHKTYDRIGNEDVDVLITLCKACHLKVHNMLPENYESRSYSKGIKTPYELEAEKRKKMTKKQRKEYMKKKIEYEKQNKNPYGI